MTTAERIEITGWGVVRRILMPPDWIEGDGFVMPDGRSLRKFVPPEKSETKICLYSRPAAVSRSAGDFFMKTLTAPFHDLDAGEMALLHEIVENAAEPSAFDRESAGTGYLNGKRILRLVGLWRDKNLKTLSVFTNADAMGCLIQNLYFASSQAEFDRYLPKLEETFASIAWNDVE